MSLLSQDQLKQSVAQAALDYVLTAIPAGQIIGVGTGSTADFFIDALGPHKTHIRGAVASSERTAARLQQQGIALVDLNDVTSLPVYVDGADEIDGNLAMIKGGGGALTREKIVASVAECFVCIADASKRVEILGAFPLPIEVIPLAREQVARCIRKLGGEPRLRTGFTTDNGNQILDVHGLRIHHPRELEQTLNQLTGIVCNGLFAMKPANVLLLGTPQGVRRMGV